MISSTYVLFNNIAFLTGLYRSFKTARLTLIKNHQILMENASKYAEEFESEKNNNIISQFSSSINDIEEDEDEFDNYNMEPKSDFLEQTYDIHKKETKQKMSILNKIVSKKKFFKEPKQPNMLTWNEKEHIRFLHQQDPVEWNVNKLSESFPALPQTIKRILKNKWKPDSLEKMKLKDQKVLENWEKLKRNELDAKPEVIEHLKKFVDRQENLKVQLENPNFFHLPEIKKKLTWNNGEMNTLLLKYEKELEILKKEQLEKLNPALLSDESEQKSAVAIMETEAKNLEKATENENTLKEIIEMEKNIQNITNEDSFLIGRKLNKSEKQLTLDSLRKEILEKSERAEGAISVLEKTIIHGNADESKSFPSEKSISVLNNTEQEINDLDSIQNDNKKNNKLFVKQLMKILSRKSSGGKANINKDLTVPKIMKMDKNKIVTTSNKSKKEINDLVQNPDEQTIVLNETNVKTVFNEKKQIETSVEVNEETKAISPPKEEKKVVEYWNTEKDQLFYSTVEKDLSETSFWKDGKIRTKSKDSGMALNTNNMPHNSVKLEEVYFDYKYPERIKIPKAKQGQGLTFRFKDCYYDESGWFLYRVPGIKN